MHRPSPMFAAQKVNSDHPLINAINKYDVEAYFKALNDLSNVNEPILEFTLGKLASKKAPLMLVLDKLEADRKANALQPTAAQGKFYESVIPKMVDQCKDADLCGEIHNIEAVGVTFKDSLRQQAQRLMNMDKREGGRLNPVGVALTNLLNRPKVESKVVIMPDFH